MHETYHTVVLVRFGHRAAALRAAERVRQALRSAYFYVDAGAAPDGGELELFVQTKGLESELEAYKAVLGALTALEILEHEADRDRRLEERRLETLSIREEIELGHRIRAAAARGEF